MSKEIIGIGSETKPLILVTGEYQQWKRRMIRFLDLIDKNLMKSICEGPLRVTITTPETAEMDDSPKMPAYEVLKPYDKYTPAQKERAAVDDRALSLLTMALTNEMYARVDCLTSAKAVRDEIELQLEGGVESKESEREIAMSAYEGCKVKDGEPLFDSYTRLNSFVNDLRRIGIHKTNYEVNVKFLKNLTEAW